MIDQKKDRKMACPQCGENWQHGWTLPELVTFFESGVNAHGKQTNDVKCKACSFAWPIESIAKTAQEILSN